MEATRLTLLERAGGGSADAWSDLDRLYRPFIGGWFRRQGLDHDADDLTQEVMTALVREVPRFQHAGRTGAFRAWLRTLCLNRLLNYRRSKARHANGVGGSEFLDRMQSVESPDDPNAADWDREHDRAVLSRLFGLLCDEFDPKTFEAFRLLTVSEQRPAEVAAALGMSLGAVYVAKSRVLRRLREEAEGMVDPAFLETPGA